MAPISCFFCHQDLQTSALQLDARRLSYHFWGGHIHFVQRTWKRSYRWETQEVCWWEMEGILLTTNICLKKKHLIENPSRYENTVKHIEIHSNLRTCTSRIHFNRRLKQTSLLYYGQYVVECSRSPCLWLVQMGLGMLGPKHGLFENHQVNAVASHRA